MLNVFYDFIPVLLFFLAFKIYGIYVATVVGIATTALQVLITFFWQRKVDKKQLIALGVFIVFGGMTLYFHNPIFVKWKPTIIFWIFGLVLLGSQFIGAKTLVERMLGHAVDKNITVPTAFWKRLNLAWMIFFISLGTLNLYVAYYFSTDTWVNFKFYGILSLLFIFSFLQAACLARYMTETK